MSGLAEIATRAYEDFNERGIRLMAELFFAEDVVFVDLPNLPGGGVHDGRDAAVAHLEDFFGTWEVSRIEVRELIESGGRVAARILLAVEGRNALATGLEFWHVITFSGNRITRIEAIEEREDALAAMMRS